jgi:hypothetical protein
MGSSEIRFRAIRAASNCAERVPIKCPTNSDEREVLPRDLIRQIASLAVDANP